MLPFKSVPYICAGDKIEKYEMGEECSAYGKRRGVYGVLVWKPGGERDHWVDPGVDGRITLIWMFSKWDVEVWNGSSWLRIGTGVGHL